MNDNEIALGLRNAVGKGLIDLTFSSPGREPVTWTKERLELGLPSHQQVSEWLTQCRTLQPDLRVGLREDFPGIKITVWTIDTRDTKSCIKVHHSFVLSPGVTDLETFAAWFRQCIHQAVTHEADEWIFVNGERMFDPHKE